MLNRTQTLPCYAKINLFLEVQDKRSDGYHNLGTLFQTLDCHDELKAETSDQLELICPPGITSSPDQNLVIKAAKLLQSEFSSRLKVGQGLKGLKFTLTKNLPSSAGLGGGSSNAATALILCNNLWELGLTLPELVPFAAKLGADVPFFLYGGTYFAEGIGEVLKPAPEPYPFHVVIGTPECGVDTAWAYKQLTEVRKKEWARFKALYFTYCEDPKFYQVMRNDFDESMREKNPLIESLYQQMQKFNPTKTLLCGSGASLFSLFVEKADADRCLNAIQGDCRFATVARFVA